MKMLLMRILDLERTWTRMEMYLLTMRGEDDLEEDS